MYLLSTRVKMPKDPLITTKLLITPFVSRLPVRPDLSTEEKPFSFVVHVDYQTILEVRLNVGGR